MPHSAIYRRDRGIVPKGITVIEPGDEVFFLARKADIPWCCANCVARRADQCAHDHDALDGRVRRTQFAQHQGNIRLAREEKTPRRPVRSR